MIKKKENSAKSLGSEFTIKLIWVIWPCAPQVCNLIFKKLTYYFLCRGKNVNNFLFSTELKFIKSEFELNLINSFISTFTIVQDIFLSECYIFYGICKSNGL